MKFSGTIRRIDELGRIVLPIEMRRTIGIEELDAVEIYLDGDTVLLRKHQPTCIFCRSEHDLLEYHGKLLCRVCLAAINEQEED